MWRIGDKGQEDSPMPPQLEELFCVGDGWLLVIASHPLWMLEDPRQFHGSWVPHPLQLADDDDDADDDANDDEWW